MVAVDLSKWQGVIPVATFQLWKASGVTRVLLKAGGGDDGRYQDSCWTQNYKNATTAGLIVEAYWFNGTTDPVGDAIFLRSFLPAGMRVWADVESEGGMPHWNVAQVLAFLRTLYALAYGVGVYMSTSVTFELDWTPVSSWVPLWVADYRDVSFPPVQHWTRAQVVYWQYTSSGTLPGYSGRLDLDRDYNATATAGLPAAPIRTTLLEEFVMLYIRHASTGAIAVLFPWLFDGVGGYRHVSAPEWAAATAAGAQVANLSDADWQSMMVGMKPVSGVVGQ